MENMLYFIVFTLGVILLVYLRAKTNNKYEIKINDAVIALVPIFLFLFIRGDIAEFSLGGVSVKRAIEESFNSNINNDLTNIEGDSDAVILDEVEWLSIGSKGDISHLETMLESNVQALRLKLGYPNYNLEMIQKYLMELPGLQYLIITNLEDEFMGLIPLNMFKDAIISQRYNWDAFQNDLQYNQQGIEELPGFIGRDKSIEVNASRISAMEMFDNTDMKILPVFENNSFVGIIERDKLLTKLLINFSYQLQKDRE